MFPEKVEQVLSELEHFVASADSFNVSGADDLYVLFQDCMSAETKALVTQVSIYKSLGRRKIDVFFELPNRKALIISSSLFFFAFYRDSIDDLRM